MQTKTGFNQFKSSINNRESNVMRKKRTIDLATIVQLKTALKTVGISFIVSFVVFFMIQVVWGGEFASALPPDIVTAEESIFWIQLMLLIGLFIGFGISAIIFYIMGEENIVKGIKEKKRSQRWHMLTSAAWSLLVTFIVLIIISYISVFAYDPYIFVDLSFIDYFGTVFTVITYFVIYVFPEPTFFWIVSVIVYYALLFVIFMLNVPPSKKIVDGKRMERIRKIRDSMYNERELEDHRKISRGIRESIFDGDNFLDRERIRRHTR